ncbi:MAG: D-alanine--D-alanine ligase [Pseudomonadota bacterium]
MSVPRPVHDGSSHNARRIEVVTTETEGMIESGFGSLATCRGISECLSSEYPLVQFNNVTSERDLEEIVARAPDLVVLCVKYIFDDKAGRIIWLSDYFGKRSIIHTGSDFATLNFDSNKSRAKTILRNKGMRTAEYFLAQPGAFESGAKLPLPFPLFVKPLSAANGNGIDADSMVHDFTAFEAKVAAVAKTYGKAALVEQVLTGREFTVAVLGDSKDATGLVMPVEVIVPPNENGDRILGHQAKTENEEQLCVVEGPLHARLVDYAGQAFALLGGRDFGRIDIKLDAAGAPHFLEANLVPGMTPGSSYFPRACKINAGMSYGAVVLKIVDLALTRARKAAAV